jgi:xylan 1,4-beta-xylosidase
MGSDCCLTGTTMRSRDLVNRRTIGWALERLDLGPDFRLEGRSALNRLFVGG